MPLFKKRKLLGAPTHAEITILLWGFAHVFFVAMPPKLCMELFVVAFSCNYKEKIESLVS